MHGQGQGAAKCDSQRDPPRCTSSIETEDRRNNNNNIEKQYKQTKTKDNDKIKQN